MGRPAKNLVGNKYGKLTVLERDTTKTKEPYYHCLCDCGTNKTVRGSNLTSNTPTLSCGCLRLPPPAPDRLDLTGERFGNLTAVSAAPGRRNRSTMWFCQCSCGNVALVRTKALRAGVTVSCGCIERQPHGNPRTPPTCTPEQRSWHNLVDRGETGDWGCKEQFLEVMGTKPEHNYQLTRIDVRQPHGPNNSIWSQHRGERQQYSITDNDGIDISELFTGQLNSLAEVTA